jgi:hypothetical protein
MNHEGEAAAKKALGTAERDPVAAGPAAALKAAAQLTLGDTSALAAPISISPVWKPNLGI